MTKRDIENRLRCPCIDGEQSILPRDPHRDAQDIASFFDREPLQNEVGRDDIVRFRRMSTRRSNNRRYDDDYHGLQQMSVRVQFLISRYGFFS